MDYTNLESNQKNINNIEETITMTAFIPTLPNENAKYIYRLSRTVRLFAVLDFIFGIFMFFFGPIGMYIIVRLFCSFSGYYGAKRYDYCLTNLYLIFLVLGTIAELGFIYIYEQLYHDNKITQNVLLVGIGYQILFFILKIYICRFVCIFSSKMFNLDKCLKNDLIKYDNQPVEIIYW